MKAQSTESLFSSFFYLGATRVGVAAMNLVATSRLAQQLGAENFGICSFAVSYLSYFLIVVNLGFETFVAREIACGERKLHDLVGGAIAMRLLLAAVLTILLWMTLPLLHLTPIGRTVILIQAISLFTAAFGVTCVYQGLQRMRMLAWREFLSSFVNMVGILWLVHVPSDVVLAVCISAATQMFANLTILARLAADFGIPRIWHYSGTGLRLARESMAYFWSLVMITITYNTHIVLLGLLRGTADVGLFTAGWKLFIFAIAVPNLAATLFMPRIANRTNRPAERQRTAELLLQTIVVSILPITVFGSLLTPKILILLFGPPYLSASHTLVLLLLNALVVAINIGLGTWMTGVGQQAALLRVVAIGAGTGVVLNLIMIPMFGIEGAALGTLIDELAIMGMFLWVCPSLFGPNPLEFALRCLLAIAPAALAVRVVSDLAIVQGSDLLNIVASTIVGMIVYLSTLRVVCVDPWKLIMELRQLR